MLQKSRSNLILSAVALAVSFIIMAGVIFAWFAFNSAADINNVELTLTDYNVDISFSTDSGATWKDYSGNIEDCRFKNVFSGNANRKTLILSCKNNSRKALYLTWFFCAPAASDEVPYKNESENTYYYLGSQLQVSDITATINGGGLNIADNTAGKGKYLVTTATAPQGSGQVTSVSEPVTGMAQLELINNLLINSGETIVITLTFVFIDNGENQNVYQVFSGNCSRRLAVLIKDTD